MSKEIKDKPVEQKKVAPKNEGSGQVVQMGPVACKFDACKHKPKQFGFCPEHYELYMAGVVRGDGHKPIDFDQKFALFMKDRTKKVA